MTGWTLCIGYGSSDLFVILVHYKLHLSPSFACYTTYALYHMSPPFLPLSYHVTWKCHNGYFKELSSSSSSWMMAHCQCHSLFSSKKFPQSGVTNTTHVLSIVLYRIGVLLFMFLVAFLHVSSTNTNSQMFHLFIYLWFKLVDSLEAHVGWCHPILEADMDCLSDTYIYLTCSLLPFFLHTYIQSVTGYIPSNAYTLGTTRCPLGVSILERGSFLTSNCCKSFSSEPRNRHWKQCYVDLPGS